MMVNKELVAFDGATTYLREPRSSHAESITYLMARLMLLSVGRVGELRNEFKRESIALKCFSDEAVVPKYSVPLDGKRLTTFAPPCAICDPLHSS